MAGIPCPQRLYLRTALQLFDIKVASVGSYGIQAAWNNLAQLEELEKVKPTFLKRVMELPRNAQNRLVYVLAACTPLVDDLVTRHRLPWTPQLGEFRRRLAAKSREVPDAFPKKRGFLEGLQCAIPPPEVQIRGPRIPSQVMSETGLPLPEP